MKYLKKTIHDMYIKLYTFLIQRLNTVKRIYKMGNKHYV